MCDLFGTKKAAKKSAAASAKAEAETKAAEAKRQADIKEGNTRIDSAFSGYNNDYYNKYVADNVGNYNPQIDKQYGDAVDRMTAALAGRGTLDSTYGATRFGELQKTRDNERLRVANDAQGSVGELKGKVAARKSDLYLLNAAAADPEGARAQAIGAATALTAPPGYSQLGQIFSSVLDPIMAYQRANVNSPGNPYTYRPKSSYSVVN